MVSAFVRFMRWFGTTGLPRPYIVGSGERHTRLKEMETLQKGKPEKRLVVNLVSPVAHGAEMARFEIQREREMAESKTFVPPGRRQNVYRSITADYY